MYENPSYPSAGGLSKKRENECELTVSVVTEEDAEKNLPIRLYVAFIKD